PTKIGHILQWKPAIAPVTGDMTYTATWLEEPPTTCTVIWRNYNGAVLETDEEFALGTQPEYNGATPTKVDANSNYTYSFVGWKRADDNTLYTASTLPNTTEDVTYVAQFEQAIKTYRVRFYKATVDGGAQLGADQNLAYGATPVVPEYSKAPTDAMTYTLVWTPLVGTVTGDQDYHASFTEQTRQYTVTWKNDDGSTITTDYVNYNGTPVYSFATPTKPAANNKIYTFSGWDPAIATVKGNQVYTAQFEERDAALVVETAEVLSSSVDVQTITIEPNGVLTANPGVVISTDVLVLEADGDLSGQLVASKVSAQEAYFDWTPNGEAGTASRTWYAIAVPWEVDAENGIFLKETGRHLVIGQDFDLIYYDGATRALQGNKPACWKYVQHDANKTMHPGQLYMMYFDPGFVTIRFAKKSGSAVIYNSPVNVSTYSASDDKDANWNGIANPRTYYASLSAGTATFAQVLNNGNLDDYFANPGAPVYQTINLASSKFTVGKPLFVQATQATPVVVTKQTTAGIVNAAPRRRAAAAELPKGIAAVYRLAIAGEGQPEADNLFVQVAEDEKADRYTIGQDLVKGGVASGRAQVWVNRYDAKLSVNTQALSEDEATYPLTIQVPANGDYVLSVGANENEDYALYLTRDGEAIWNLSDGEYTGSFEKGTTSEYGLRVSARAPQITTGIDEAVVDAKGETRKVLINNTVYIIRGENVYSVDGQLVK
ncbi:MAG: hypothetical protein IJR42_06815, partial [Paludibacteraceae bacterium]|nr:hypothetical protein [Paludibacteraceae bacterium]